MPSRDARIDAYIQKAQPFAQPILAELRARLHATVPGLEETIKWNAPFFLLDGKTFASIAGFKAHAKLNLWKSDFKSAMPTAYDFRSMEDLPTETALARLFKASAATFVAGKPAEKRAAVKKQAAGNKKAK